MLFEAEVRFFNETILSLMNYDHSNTDQHNSFLAQRIMYRGSLTVAFKVQIRSGRSQIKAVSISDSPLVFT
mgnify:CR=1 FL=1